MKKNNYYELTPSQDVIQLQTKYTLFKRVVNIIFSATVDEEFNKEVMTKAINEVIKRNDCLRLRFEKHKGSLRQYIVDSHTINSIKSLSFNSKEEQQNWLLSYRKKTIKYLKGVVFEPLFIKTYDNKYMLLTKVCHLILDIYGINNLYKDIFNVYNALLENTELPKPLESYEQVIIHDLNTKHNNEKMKKHYEFFKEQLQNKPEPYYVGINGLEEPIIKKIHKKNKRAMKMFFINNDTEGYEHEIDKLTMDKVINFCEINKFSLANVMFYCCNLAASLINDKKECMLHLQLCNMRVSQKEKNTCGTKVQSVGTYTQFDFNKTFIDSVSEFCLNQLSLYKHIALPDMNFEQLVHNVFPSSMLETYYSLTFSFIPYESNDNIRYELHSNGKGALPCYLALLYDVNNGNVRMCYDCQTKIIKEHEVKNFHNKYVELLNKVCENPNILLKSL